MGKRRKSFWFTVFMCVLLIMNSLSSLQVNAEADSIQQLSATDEITKTTIHTYGANTWAYSSLAKGLDDAMTVAHVENGTRISLKRWNGTQWNSLTSVTATATADTNISGPLMLVSDQIGNLHLVFKFVDGTGLNSYRGVKYGFYNSQTNSWSFTDIAGYSDPNGWKSADDPTLAVDSNGKAHVAYIYNDANTRNHTVMYANNLGGAFASSAILTSNGGIDELFTPNIEVHSSGQIHLTYIKEDQQNNYYGNLYYVTKKISESSFSSPLKIINSTGENDEYWSFPLTLDSNGSVYIAYSGLTSSYILSNASGSWKREKFFEETNGRVTGPLSVQFVGSDIYLLMESWTTDWSDVYFFAMAKTASGWIKGTKNILPAEPGPYSELTYEVDSNGNYMLVMLDDNLRIISSLSGTSKAFGLTPVAGPTFSVIYEGNGHNSGTVPTDAKKYAQGESVVVLGNSGSLQKTGHTFDGWNTASNGTGTSYGAGSSFAMPATDVTLYAKWKANQYTVSFNTNGGSAVPAVTVDYNSTITAPAAPTKAGYTFAGWYKDAGLATPWNFTTDKVTASMTLYAKWTISQYTVSFDVDGGSVVSPQTVNHGAKAVQPAAPTKTGYTFAGWYTNKTYTSAFDFNGTVITANTIIYAKWNVNQYTVNFDSLGGSTVDAVKANYNTTIAAPVAPTKVGYTFSGWYKEAGFVTPWNFATDKVTQDTTLYSKWTVNQYTVSFNVDGGSAVAPQTVDHGSKIVAPVAPTKTGYTFGGWYKEASLGTPWNFATDIVTGNTTLYAKWTVNQYTVSFDVGGGSAVAAVVADYNTTIAAPVAPTKVGYTFSGWYKEAGFITPWNFATDKVTQNITLYAKWTINQYTVGFDVDGGSAVAQQTVNHGSKLVEPVAPTKTGYTFGGWYKETSLSTPWNFATDIVTGNTTLFAKWTVNQYTVSFDVGGGSTVAAVVADYNTTIAAPVAPTKVGYTFSGWYKEAGFVTPWNFATDKVTQNTTLYAKWTINQYTVNFDSTGGSAVAPQTVNHGSNLVEPVAPTKTGYTFGGWYKEASLGTPWIFATDIVTDNTTLYAKWTVNQYTVSFDSNGGSAVAEIVADYNTTIAAPAVPTKVGYTFSGWYKEAGYVTPWNFATDKVTQDTTLYAKWTINQYTVSFDVDGGSLVLPQTLDHGSKVLEPVAPTKTGYTFGGWYKEASFNTPWNFATDIVTDNTTLYAKWMVNQYTVSFDSTGGSAVAAVVTDYNTTIAAPVAPTKVGYTFSGWYKEAGLVTPWNFTTDKVTQDITLYAKWTINQYTVSFDSAGGSAVAAVVTDYNTTIAAPVAPTKVGHTFGGWYKEAGYVTLWNFATDKVTQDTTLYAKWTINQYTVSFDSAGGSAVAAVVTDYNTTIAAPVAPTKVGHTFGGWYKEAGHVTAWNFATDKVTEDTTLYAKWTINQYTVSFDSAGGSAVAAVVTDYNTTIAAPVAPTKVGYTFDGWYKEAGYVTPWNFATDKVTQDTTLYAKWTINQYTVSFDPAGGSALAAVVTDYNTTIAAPVAPTKVGYTFSGWYKEAGYVTVWNFATDKVTQDTTLYAKWTINQYTVSFDSTGGSAVAAVVTDYNTTIAAPVAPTKVGYTFDGWYKEAGLVTPWNFTTDKVTQDTTLYAKWTINQYTVSFDSTGGSAVAAVVTDYNTTIAAPLTPVKVGYTFGGWYKEARFVTLWNFAVDKVTQDTKLYAKWIINGYTVSFNSDGGSAVAAVRADYDTTIAAPVLPIKLGHTFGGWYKEAGLLTPWNFTTDRVYGNTTLFAKWSINQYKVSFDSDGGSAVAQITTNYNSTILVPAAPTKPGYTFVGWYKDASSSTLWNFQLDKVTNDLTLFAKWKVHSSHSTYIRGYSDQTFRPNEHISRAQMAVALMRNIGISTIKVLGYDDVVDTHWAHQEIMLAKQSGIMLGVGKSFKPNQSITRAEMATIVYRWIKKECSKDPNAYKNCSMLEQKADGYSDVPLNHGAAEGILAIQSMGIMDGFADGTFLPNEYLTRAQAVKVINRLFKRGPLTGDFEPSFKDVPKNHWAFMEIEEAVRSHYFEVDENGREVFSGSVE